MVFVGYKRCFVFQKFHLLGQIFYFWYWSFWYFRYFCCEGLSTFWYFFLYLIHFQRMTHCHYKQCIDILYVQTQVTFPELWSSKFSLLLSNNGSYLHIFCYIINLPNIQYIDLSSMLIKWTIIHDYFTVRISKEYYLYFKFIFLPKKLINETKGSLR